MLKVRTEDNDDVRKKVLRDGEFYRVPLLLCDSLQRAIAASATVTDAASHRPHAVALSDADKARRVKLYQDYEASLASRWRTPPALPVELQAPAVIKQPVSTDLAKLHAESDHKLSERWKGPAKAA